MPGPVGARYPVPELVARPVRSRLVGAAGRGREGRGEEGRTGGGPAHREPPPPVRPTGGSRDRHRPRVVPAARSHHPKRGPRERETSAPLRGLGGQGPPNCSQPHSKV